MDKPEKIKILFLAANPKDSTPLRLGEEVKIIKRKLEESDLRDNFLLEQEWAVSIDDLQKHLLKHRPNILHFSGHGTKEGIFLENVLGKSKLVSTKVLKKLFSLLKKEINCVVLNSCYSENQAKSIAQSIDCVIGMSNSVKDSAAIAFAGSFYLALGFGEDLKTAFDLGCLQIDIESLDQEGVPKIITRMGKDPNELFILSNKFNIKKTINNVIRILLVDDDIELSNLLVHTLRERLEYTLEIVQAFSIKDVVYHLKKKAFTIAVVDMNLGDKGKKAGLTIVDVIKSSSSNTKVFVFSGYSETLNYTEVLNLASYGINNSHWYNKNNPDSCEKLINHIEQVISEL